jgi:hypothetical protein
MRISSTNTKTYFLRSEWKIVFIKDWKGAGALVKPNGITLNSQWPL